MRRLTTRCADTIAALALAALWRPIGWDVPLTRPAPPRQRAWVGQWSQVARRWVRM